MIRPLRLYYESCFLDISLVGRGANPSAAGCCNTSFEVLPAGSRPLRKSWLNARVGGTLFHQPVAGTGTTASRTLLATLRIPTASVAPKDFSPTASTGIVNGISQMPQCRISYNVIPRRDAWNRRVPDNQPLNLIGIARRVGVRDHDPDVVRHYGGLVISERRNHCSNVACLRFSCRKHRSDGTSGSSLPSGLMAAGIASAAGLKQKPDPSLSFVNPHFYETRRGHVIMVLADVMSLAEAGDEGLIVVH